jgi:cytochrome P450
VATATADTPIVPADGAERPLPRGAELGAVDATFRKDPYPVLERLRSAAPVYWDADFARWFITGSDEVRSILRNKDMSSNPLTARSDSYSAKFIAGLRHASMEGFLGFMVSKDDPDHRRLRSLVSKPFGAKESELLRPRIRQVAEQLLDNVTEVRFDLIKSLADPLPLIVIGDMLDIDVARREQFKRWSEDAIRGLFNPIRTAQETQLAARAAQGLRSYFAELIEARRQAPADDLISSMIVAKDEDSQPLADEEILAQCMLLLIAGNVTTTDFIGNAVRVLLLHPQQLAALRAEPELIKNAIEEVLRYETPVMHATRVVPEDMTVAGCPFHKGQSVQLALGAANRDPRANSEPDRFDIRRRDIRHHSFGGNRHLCLGAHLARVEAQEALSALLRRYPKLELAEQEFQFRAWPGFRGTHELWLWSRSLQT